MLRLFSISLGCPKNRVDTEQALGVLGRLTPVEGPEQADLVFINTCGFIQSAVREGVRTILEVAQRAKDSPKRPLVAVAGCLVGRYGARELAQELPEVDVWLEGRDASQWGLALAHRLGLAGAPGGRLFSTGPAYAYLKLSEGCNHACSFCTIPAIRGALRSTPVAALEKEARALVAQGARELVLVAQDTTAYGRDLADGTALVPLLERLLGLPSLAWIRLLYLYPAGVSEELLRFVRQASGGGGGPRLLPYFDVPLQHADMDILTRMGRPFADDPQRVVDRIRRHLPEAALRTSLIVGFPGESGRQFETLVRFVEKNRFHQLGVFAYEAEEGTPAAAMPGQVPRRKKIERRAALMEVQKGISRELLAQCVGERLEVLVEGESGEWPGLHTGRVWFQAPEVDGLTYISGAGVRPGALLEAGVAESGDYDLTALV